MKKIVPVILSVLMSFILILSGCKSTEDYPIVQRDMSEFTLSQLWETVLDTTGIQSNTAELTSFWMLAENGMLRMLYLHFYGINDRMEAKSYFANMNGRGELTWYCSERNTSMSNVTTIDPDSVFGEIDNTGIIGESSLSASTFELRVNFTGGDVGYRDEYLDVYKLEDGNLSGIERITFHTSKMWCTISFLIDGNPQIWLLNEDVNRADILEYK